MSKYRFLVLGRAGLDLYADPPGSRTEDSSQFFAALGGSAANIAVGIVRLGGGASLATCVSDDAVGRYTLNQLNFYGVGTEHISIVGGEARNSLAVVETRLENCQSVIYRNGAADLQLTTGDVASIKLSNYDYLIVTGTGLATEPSRSATLAAMKAAKLAKLKIVLDIDYRPYSWISAEDAASVCEKAAAMSDILVGNDVEFGVLANGGDSLALAKSYARKTASHVIYKMGEKGSICFTDDTSFETGVYDVDALKPTGAGDSFMASFIMSLVEGDTFQNAVQRGSAAAALVVTRVACAPAMPDANEVLQFMSTHTLRAFNAHSAA